jgi:hypothetical protein
MAFDKTWLHKRAWERSLVRDALSVGLLWTLPAATMGKFLQVYTVQVVVDKD